MPEEIEVPTEELHEKMGEAAEEAGEGRKWISRVALSSALLAVLAAISALLAGHHANEAMLDQMKATDQWAFFQAKGIKAAVTQQSIDMMVSLGKPEPVGAEQKMADYQADQAKIKDGADELEHSSEDHMSHHVELARGVTVFQVAIAMGAIAVLSRRPKLWLVSVSLGGLGLLFFILGLL